MLYLLGLTALNFAIFIFLDPLWVSLYHLASRLAYFSYVASRLNRQRRHQGQNFDSFRETSSLLMNNDALSFLLTCFATSDTMLLPISRTVSSIIALFLIVVGITTKLWSAFLIGKFGYYWGDFFMENKNVLCRRGPYRFFTNPMYGLGYLHAYGLSILFLSAPGLAFSVFDQACVYAIYFLYEKRRLNLKYQ